MTITNSNIILLLHMLVVSKTKYMKISDYLFTFDPNKKGMKKVLGDLEAEIMEIIWLSDYISVRDVFEQLKEKRKIAYTTVMTVMTRLSDKGLLKKKKDGNAFLYKAVYSREMFTQSTVSKIIKGVFEDLSAPAMAGFVDSIGEEEAEKIRELSKLIDKKKRTGNAGSGSINL